MSLNSYKNQRKIHFKKNVIEKNYEYDKKIIIIPHVKLKGIWFSEEQNKIVLSMFSTTFIIGLVIGFLIGIIL